MDKTTYTLKTDQSKTVEVPSDYAEKAQELVAIALLKPVNIADAVSDHPYLTNLGIMSSVKKLCEATFDSPNAKKLVDEVYLRVCIYGLSKTSSFDNMESLNMENELMYVVNNL